MLRVLDLFSGIGGFSLGFERAGMKTAAFCEIEPFCRAVLRKHWPNVVAYEDVRELNASRLREDGIECDVICGGFPCQDVSLAGRRKGLGDTRSGLWREYARLVGEIRPRFVVVENTPGLLSLGMGNVLGDLAALGYDAEWHCIPASCVGADHIRDRVWIIANLVRQGLQGRRDPSKNKTDAPGIGAWIGSAIASSPTFPREYCQHQPLLGGGIYGIPNRVDRIKSLGNAVVPQIAEILGRAIVEFEG